MRAIDCKEDQLSSIILAGGDGTRLNSLTRKIAGEQNERFYKPLAFNGIETNLAVQPTTRGTAPAVLFGLFRLIKAWAARNRSDLPVRSLRE
jgi:mannose-1-phosphate guanylyltransferase